MQKVQLINKPTLEFVDSGIGQCWDKGAYGAGTEKGAARIERVCNKRKHNSMLRFASYIFKVDLSTSALLEWTRHQVGVDYAVTSTRYTLKHRGITWQPSNNPAVNDMLAEHIADISVLIENNPGIGNDDLKLLLPQAFLYEMQVQFNAQSLQHFIKLRSDKSAHYHIRRLAVMLFEHIPDDHKYLFTDVLATNTKDI